MDPFLQAALDEARQGLAEGGIPIGSVLVLDGRIIGRGHNRRAQKGSAILHAEMDCLENAGRRTAREYRRATLYSTLSPCDMCSGTALLYKIPRIVIGENQTFQGPEAYLRSRGGRARRRQRRRMRPPDACLHRGTPPALERRHWGVEGQSGDAPRAVGSGSR